MYKAVNNLKEQKGFTLIELLIVVAIIGILAAIAVPAYIGQREKARVRAVEASAKGSVSDTLAVLDAYVAGDPYILLTAAAAENCIESTAATTTGKTCLSIYNQAADQTYTAYPNGIEDIIDDIIAHHLGKREQSPFDGGTLFVKDTATAGRVVLSDNGTRSINVFAYAESIANPIFSTSVFAR